MALQQTLGLLAVLDTVITLPTMAQGLNLLFAPAYLEDSTAVFELTGRLLALSGQIRRRKPCSLL
jgi:hypothetical protein